MEKSDSQATPPTHSYIASYAGRDASMRAATAVFFLNFEHGIIVVSRQMDALK
jgi:hypothetical protein